MILSAALAITNAVLFIVCRACSGCWDWLEPVPNGPLAGEWRLSEALFWFRKTASELSFWGGVGNAALDRALKKTLEALYTTKVNNRVHTSRGTTLPRAPVSGASQKKICHLCTFTAAFS